MKRVMSSILYIGCICRIFAAPPLDLPGEELTNEKYLDYLIQSSVSSQEISLEEAEASLAEDTARIFSTWSAPSIADQLAQDTVTLRFGMGALFVPRMSEEGAIEPEIVIKNQNDEFLSSGPTGQKFNLMPGKYRVYVGNQVAVPIVREVFVEEGEITPLIPDWCALRIEVVDENAKAIRGEYELVFLDSLMSIGRGRGRDVDLAENLRIWFLPLGTYKILGVGASFNSISNFLTVRLLIPGEFVRFTIVQDEKEEKILGGGILDLRGGRQDRFWTHSLNIGGSVDFNFFKDNKADTTDNTIGFSLLLYDRFGYKRNKVEIGNLIRLDLAMTLDDFNIKTLKSTVDELRISSLFTYRLVSRFGPYARGEYITSILPRRINRFGSGDDDIQKKEELHAFLFYESLPTIVTDSTVSRIDTHSESVTISPAFSPMQLQTGIGGNVQLFRNRILDMRFLTGFGIDYETRWDTWVEIADEELTFDTTSDVYQKYYRGDVSHTNLLNASEHRLDYGPEFMLNMFLNLGIMSIDSDVRLFMPLMRFRMPDLLTRNLLSLYLTKNFIIDYEHSYVLTQAAQEHLRTNQHRHRILARLSFSTR